MHTRDRAAMVARATALSILVGLTTSPALADDESVNNAFRICALLDGTGMTSQPCDVSGWGSSVNAWIDMSAGEAQKLCPQIAGLAREKGWRFRPGWTLKIYSPYSGENIIAWCRL